MKTRWYVVLTSKHSHIPVGMKGKGKFDKKLGGYALTFTNLTSPVPFNQTTQDTTLFFEKHEVKRLKTD